MSDQFWLTPAQLNRINPHFPLSHGVAWQIGAFRPRVDDLRVISGIIHVIRSGLRWARRKKIPKQQQTPTVQKSLDLALQHHTAGRLPKAEGLYQQVLQADPNQPVALHLLGVIAHQVGKNDFAVDLIGKALAINPDFAEAHNNL